MSATPEALAREASAFAAQGRVLEAIDAYQRLLTRWPERPTPWYNLAILQRKAGEFQKALDSYQQALRRGIPRPEEVHLNCGVIYADYLRDYVAAERELSAALELDPAYVPALLNLGNLHEDLGRREAAIEAYTKILAIDPNCSSALARRANLSKSAAADDFLIGRLKRAIAEPTAGPADRADLGFALGRLLDLAGSYPAAFQAYEAANRDSRASAPEALVYDRATEEQFFDRIEAAFPTVRRAGQAPAVQSAPVFICGMFRSGSTLIEHVLARHPLVKAGGELEFIPRTAQETLAPFPESMATVSAERLEAISARYLEQLAQFFPDAKFVTDKRPDNFVFIGLIKALFPNAKIVHTTRDPIDTCLSIFFLHLDHRMTYALDLNDTAHHYLLYAKLMKHWKALYGDDIIDVHYDAFVREPQPMAQRLLDFLGLEWDDRCLVPEIPAGASIKTASVWQVREPLYLKSSGRARHYERDLENLRALLKT